MSRMERVATAVKMQMGLVVKDGFLNCMACTIISIGVANPLDTTAIN